MSLTNKVGKVQQSKFVCYILYEDVTIPKYHYTNVLTAHR